MLKRILLLSLCVFSLPLFAQDSTPPNDANGLQGESKYIKDDLTIFMHAGPGREFRIIGTIDAGSKVILLQTDDEKGFAEIQDERNRTGWVVDSNVTDKRSMREILPETVKQLNEAQLALQNTDQRITDLNQQISDLTMSNQQLQQRYDTLNDTYKLLQKQQQVQDQSSQKEWFTRGGIVAFGGVILGIILTYIPKRKRRSDNWM
ncbi:TIGR04211 family SH3 domain-containing protein [Neptunicella marina]|uniref:TIGR04211 family SH3 domain-containing protein n=1 Tax=Neptunicella marina TaxID=2125989 RepID=A0A8J6IU02_9ALTE|nr:TIGR04211 family SH3 domain-containing protein [Neptunicella marina]MBC3766304.1 TIGR04211 family SH3 domain-containing protein [Neptunicella marina]